MKLTLAVLLLCVSLAGCGGYGDGVTVRDHYQIAQEDCPKSAPLDEPSSPLDEPPAPPTFAGTFEPPPAPPLFD